MEIEEFENNSNEVFTVSKFISLLNSKIRNLKIDIIGEVSEMKMSSRGHAYPVIKDKETGDILPCTMWASDYVLNGVELEVGAEIMAKGYPEFYGPFGKLSFHIKSFQLVGEGQLKKAYDKLKKKLSTEGLFDENKKRPLPDFPKKIGVITSIRGEAIHDFSNNLRKSGFKIKILHSPVEGPESGRNLTLSVRAFKKEDIDVLVLIRGGGSMQSLAGFDNKSLVREIVSFPKPVIVGIGHHQDVPLSALAADISESTPSMVASVIGKSWNEADKKIEELEKSISDQYKKVIKKTLKEIEEGFNSANSVMNSIFKKYKEYEYRIYLSTQFLNQKIYENKKDLKYRLIFIERSLAKNIEIIKTKKINDLYKKSLLGFFNNLDISLNKINDIYRFIQTNDPKKQMKLGYSITMKKGRVIKSKKELKIGEEINVKIYDGDIISKIKKIK